MPPEVTRRGGRILKQVAMSLVGSDMEGRIFSEQTKTVVLSRHGAGIISAYKLSPEQELVVRCVDSNKEAEVRVVGQIGAQGDVYIYGVAFVNSEINFWGIDFPALSETEQRASRTLMECSNCHTREIADHSDLESDVYAVNKSIRRYCKRCGSSTLWKQPSGEVIEEPAPRARPLESSAEPEPKPAAAVSAQASRAELPSPGAEAKSAPKERENRRKHARTKVNFKACIRRNGFPDDVVSCEDMSRGGLRFKSRNAYHEKTFIEVAVPYAPGGQSIFVPGQIAFVQELPEQKMFRCGVAYVRSRK